MQGQTPAEIFRTHGRRHVAIAALAAAGSAALSLATGSVIVETVFYLPGLGRLMLDAAVVHDAPLVKSAVLTLMIISVVLAVALRLVAGWADPRISQRAAA